MIVKHGHSGMLVGPWIGLLSICMLLSYATTANVINYSPERNYIAFILYQ